jgi:hypothetical protein
MTAQVSEKLIYKGQELNLCAEPLHTYLETIRGDLKFVAHSSANWRGYVGTWCIEDERLYLAKLNGTVREGEFERAIELGYLFPDYPVGVFAHWFTGELRCVQGGLLKYVHMGYSSTYEKDLFIRIQNGVVLGDREITNGVSESGKSDGYVLAAATTFGTESRP